MRFVTDLWTQGERVEPSRSKNPNHVPCTEVVLYSPDAVVRNLYALADSILYGYILAIVYSRGEKKIPKTLYSSGSAQFSLGTEENPFEWSQL